MYAFKINSSVNSFILTKRQADVIISLFVGLLFFIFSLWIIDFYQYGDQSHYRKYWMEVEGLNFFDAYALLFISLGSAEPGYAVITYFFSGLVDKDIVMSVLNAMIVYYIMRWMLKMRVHIVLVPFLLLSFYLLVLFLAAERLKLAFLFILMAEHYKVFSYGWYIFALLSHMSIAIILFARYSNKLFKVFFRFLQGYIKKNNIYYFIILGISFVGFILVFQDHIISKFEAYGSKDGLSIIGIIKMLVFILGASFYAKNKFEPVFAGLPIFLAAGILGPERIVLFGYFLFMYYALQYRRGLNMGVLIVTIYFGVLGGIFMKTVIDHGDGFYFSKKIQKEAK